MSRDWFIVIVSIAFILGAFGAGTSFFNRQWESAVCLTAGTLGCAYLTWS